MNNEHAAISASWAAHEATLAGVPAVIPGRTLYIEPRQSGGYVSFWRDGQAFRGGAEGCAASVLAFAARVGFARIVLLDVARRAAR